MSKLSKHNRMARGGNSGVHYSQGGQSPNQIGPLAALAVKLAPKLIAKAAPKLVGKLGPKVAKFAANNPKLAEVGKKMFKSATGKKPQETAQVDPNGAKTTPPTLDGGGNSEDPNDTAALFTNNAPGITVPTNSYMGGAMTKQGSPYLQSSNKNNNNDGINYATVTTLENGGGDSNASASTTQTAQNAGDGTGNKIENTIGDIDVGQRQKVEPYDGGSKKPGENQPPSNANKPGSYDKNAVSASKTGDNRGGYGEFANNRRGGGMDGRPMQSDVGKAFQSVFGRDAVNLIRERSRMRKEARNEIRRGDISGISGSGYDQTIGEGKNLYKLRKTQQRLEKKKARKGDKFRSKMGLETLSGKQINITNDKGEVTSTGQAYTRGIGEGLSDGSNTYMKRGLKATRSTSMGGNGGVIANQNSITGGSGKNSADISKLGTFTEAEQIERGIHPSQSTPYDGGSKTKPIVENKLSADLQKEVNATKPKGLTSEEKSKMKQNIKVGSVEVEDDAPVIENVKLGKIDSNLPKKPKGATSATDITGGQVPVNTFVSPPKMPSLGVNIKSKQPELRVVSKLPETKNSDFKPVKDKSTDKDVKVINKLQTKKGGKLKRVAKRNPQLASEVLGDKDPNKVKEARKKVPKIKKKQLKASVRDKQRAYNEKYGIK